jgi:hypothetical protein
LIDTITLISPFELWNIISIQEGGDAIGFSSTYDYRSGGAIARDYLNNRGQQRRDIKIYKQ